MTEAGPRGWSPPAPIFRVADLDASLAYYVDALGFRIDWREDAIASVSRDACRIFLCSADQSNARVWVWLGVADVEETHAELVARGATIRFPPTSYWWAHEMQVTDPDGHVLRIGSDPKGDAGAPAPFPDASGRVWSRREDGGWTYTMLP